MIENQDVWEKSPTWFTDHVVKPIGKVFGDMWDNIKKTAEDVWEDVKNIWSDIKSSFSGGGARYTSSGGMHYGPRMVQETYSIRSIPKLANGAVIPPNQQFAAILGDQRSGVNVEAPLSTIRQAVTEALQASGGLNGNGGNVTVIMEIDGREFGRASYKYGSAERQRVGVRLTEVRT